MLSVKPSEYLTSLAVPDECVGKSDDVATPGGPMPYFLSQFLLDLDFADLDFVSDTDGIGGLSIEMSADLADLDVAPDLSPLLISLLCP